MPRGRAYPKSSKSSPAKVPAKSSSKPAVVPVKTNPPGYGSGKGRGKMSY
jgi:hypothetical protein